MPAKPLYQRVLNGDYENHVLPFLWMKGESQEVIGEYLEKMASADIHEVCLESRPHPDFCGEGWWNDLAFIVAKCKELSMKIWILDDSHFPTGFANGALKGEDVDPALRKTVLTHRTLDVVGPTPCMSVVLTNQFDKTERFYGASFMQGGASIDVDYEVVRDEAGKATKLVFDAPEGLAQLCLIFTSQKTSYNEDYINMVDKASCDMQIKAVYEPHFEHFGDEFGKTIMGFFSDEPGFANEKGYSKGPDALSDTLIGKEFASIPWSDELERRLRERLGERYMAELPHLWDRDPAGAHARVAYMDIASALYQECFCDNLGNWCHDHGVMYIGHVIEDKDSNARLGEGAGHFFRAIGGQDMAGVDIVINQIVPGMDSGFHSYGRGKWDIEFYNFVLPKMGPSAAHIDPKKQGRCMAEVFGAFGWHEGLREMKWIADHFLVRGVNWFVPHAFSMAEFPDWDCPPHFYAHGQNPQFRNFGKLMGYMNRTATLLSGGVAHNPVAVLYHADAEWAGEISFAQGVAAELTRAQIGFDFVPSEAFDDSEAYEVVLGSDGSGFSINGQVYAALVIPQREFVSEGTAAFMEESAATGMPVVCVDALPTKLYDGDAAAAAGYAELPASAFDQVSVCALDALAELLADEGLQTVVPAEPQRWLRSYHYTKAGEDYYMLVNEHPKQAVCTTLSLPGEEGTPLTGARLDVLNATEPVAFDGTLELAPYESCVVVLGASAAAAAEPGADAVELAGAWEVSFASSTAYPEFGEPVSLNELHDLSSAEFPNAAGTFRYRTGFELGEDAANVALDLGDVYEVAEVSVDGEALGARFCPPYRFEAGALAAGAHELIVDVTNTLDHSVVDMFALTEASEPSGLLGPVVVKA